MVDRHALSAISSVFSKSTDTVKPIIRTREPHETLNNNNRLYNLIRAKPNITTSNTSAVDIYQNDKIYYLLDSGTSLRYMPLRAMVDFIRFDILEYSYLSEYQYTVPHNSTGGYTGILTKLGLETLPQIIEQNNHNGIFKDYYYIKVGSGRPSVLKSIMNERCATLECEFDNLVIVGLLTDNDGLVRPKRTSIIITYEHNKWCKTISGSLYLLGTHRNPEIINKLIKQYSQSFLVNIIKNIPSK
jgi:hypothetical protein